MKMPRLFPVERIIAVVEILLELRYDLRLRHNFIGYRHMVLENVVKFMFLERTTAFKFQKLPEGHSGKGIFNLTA